MYWLEQINTAVNFRKHILYSRSSFKVNRLNETFDRINMLLFHI